MIDTVFIDGLDICSHNDNQIKILHVQDVYTESFNPASAKQAIHWISPINIAIVAVLIRDKKKEQMDIQIGISDPLHAEANLMIHCFHAHERYCGKHP